MPGRQQPRAGAAPTSPPRPAGGRTHARALRSALIFRRGGAPQRWAPGSCGWRLATA